MQLTGRRIQFGAVLAAGLLLMAATLRPQAPGGGPAWQYCSVETYADGSKRASLSGSACPKDGPGGPNRVWSTTMAAAANLGEQGWELVAANNDALYFKRLKALDNKQPFGR